MILFHRASPEIHLVGFGFFVVAVMDVIHTISFIGYFQSPLDQHDLSSRFWVAGRFVEALVLLLISKNIIFRTTKWNWLLMSLLLSIILSVFLFYPPAMPSLFINGQGATGTKILMEIVITSMFALALFFRYRKFNSWSTEKDRYVFLALLITIPGELIFAVFTSVNSYLMVLGHLLKICYYYYLFKGIFVSTITAPYRDLELSSERFYKIFHKVPVSLSIVSIDDYKYVDVNKEWVATTGYSREEIINKSQNEFNILTKDMHRLIRNRPVRNILVSFNAKNGETRDVLLTTEAIQLNGKACFLYVGIDITEKNKYEKEMSRLDRLNTVGQMAAGIGHEVRNPLTVVRGFLQLFLIRKDLSPYKKQVELMLSELDQANDIITEFLSLARTKNRESKEMDVNEVINRIMPLLTAEAYKQDKYVTAVLQSVPKTVLDENEIRQLLLNLVKNALDSMPEKGTVTLKTSFEDDVVVLAISDQGTGIPKEIQDNIGAPFFTTKKNGTGLGIATCYKVVENHKAKMDFQSSPQGTTFYIRFTPCPPDSVNESFLALETS
ncbi:PAS domain S-box protein [Heliorestis convoluta]|uniref:histidine kinase n=1 Tax=Heliorestis convoluta TaxID=356322 RepID=A0A5Q2N385_9FIRM|nr:PAS domain S-box protein [Heliorestis convoluta]